MITKKDIFSMRGELAVLRKEFEDLDIAGNNCLITINNKLSPDNIENDITDLDIRSAEVEFKQLQIVVSQAKEKKDKIKKLDGQLKEIEAALA